MKKSINLFVLLVLLSLNTYAQRIKGSDTVLPLTQKQAENFMNENKDARITITGGGSGVGISSLLEGTTDIAMSSRKIKFDEKNKFQNMGKPITEEVIAFDALAVIVNPANKVGQLTRKQLEGIFTGKIKNWKEVGGDDMQIVVYSRETSSGTYEFFKEHVLKHKNYVNSTLSLPATGAIIQSINQTKGAIGYVGIAYLNNKVKPLRVSYDDKTFVAPTFENAQNLSYPIVRPLFYYYLQENEKKVAPFINYFTNENGQKTTKKIGYIPAK